eukprot:scaffold66729_cov63-Phaeocystis_antarctica.AAC.5
MGCQGSVLAVVGTTRWSARNVFSPSACLMVATAPGVPMNPGNVTSFSATAGCETSIVVRAANIVFTDGSRLIIERWLVALSILSALLEAADEARGGDGGSEGGNASLACSRCGSFVTTVTATSDSSSRVVARSPLLLRDDMRRFLNLMTFAVTPTCVRLSGFSDSPMREDDREQLLGDAQVPQLAFGDVLVRARAVQREQARLAGGSRTGERVGLELELYASVAHHDDIRRRVHVRSLITQQMDMFTGTIGSMATPDRAYGMFCLLHLLDAHGLGCIQFVDQGGRYPNHGLLSCVGTQQQIHCSKEQKHDSAEDDEADARATKVIGVVANIRVGGRDFRKRSDQTAADRISRSARDRDSGTAQR